MKKNWRKINLPSVLTSINMTEVPILIMKIPSNKLLGRRLLCVILQAPITSLSISIAFIAVHINVKVLYNAKLVQWIQMIRQQNGTRGGKTFSAARRGIEKPPWVLVSLAVNVLQKYSVGCFLCSGKSGSNIVSFSCSSNSKHVSQSCYETTQI